MPSGAQVVARRVDDERRLGPVDGDGTGTEAGHRVAHDRVLRAVRGQVLAGRAATGQGPRGIGDQRGIDGAQLVEEPGRRLARGIGPAGGARPGGASRGARPARRTRPAGGAGPGGRRRPRAGRETRRVGPRRTAATGQRPDQRAHRHERDHGGRHDGGPPVHNFAHCPCLSPPAVFGNPLSTGAGSLAVQLRLPPIQSADTSGGASRGPVLAVSAVNPPILESSMLSSPVAPVTATGLATAVWASTTARAPTATTGPPIAASNAYSDAPALTATEPVTVEPGARQVTPEVTASVPSWRPDTVAVHTGSGRASSSTSASVVVASPVFAVTSRRYRLYRPGRLTAKARVCNRHRKLSPARWSMAVHAMPS